MNILTKIKLLLWRMLHENDVLNSENLMCYVCGNKALPQPLEPDEEVVLLEEAKAGNQTARDKLVEHNLRLVVYIAKKFDARTFKLFCNINNKT